jgi:hypothetical protein
VPTNGTVTKFFFALSIAFLIASGISAAFPVPQPTLPFWSPTTTSATNRKLRPPLTTFATRLSDTTFSANSLCSFGARRLFLSPLLSFLPRPLLFGRFPLPAGAALADAAPVGIAPAAFTVELLSAETLPVEVFSAEELEVFSAEVFSAATSAFVFTSFD